MVTDSMLAQAAAELNFAMLCSLPDTAECSHTFSASFEKKMKRILRRGNHPVLYRYAQRAATVLLVFLLGFMALITVSPTVRAAVFGWIRQQHKSFTQYSFTSTAGEETATECYELAYLPEGYYEYIRNEIRGNITIYYQSPNKDKVMYFIYSKNSKFIEYYLKFDPSKLEEVSIDGYKADFYQSNHKDIANSLFWQDRDSNTFFGLSAFVEKTELIKIAKNVKQMEN